MRAWRYTRELSVLYVEVADESPNRTGDAYSYTSDVNKAADLTERECARFVGYMRCCGTMGYVSA